MAELRVPVAARGNRPSRPPGAGPGRQPRLRTHGAGMHSSGKMITDIHARPTRGNADRQRDAGRQGRVRENERRAAFLLGTGVPLLAIPLCPNGVICVLQAVGDARPAAELGALGAGVARLL